MNAELLHDSKIYEHLLQLPKISEIDGCRLAADTEFQEIMLWSTRDRYNNPVLRREFHHDKSRQSSRYLVLKVAQELSRKKLLLTSIILPRSNTQCDSNQHKVISTFAYRMALNIPRTQQYIMDAIEADPSIFDLNTETQIRKLIEEPLINAALGASHAEKRWWASIVVIDGSHDQMAPDSAASRIVNALHDLSRRDDLGITLCLLLITSGGRGPWTTMISFNHILTMRSTLIVIGVVFD